MVSHRLQAADGQLQVAGNGRRTAIRYGVLATVLALAALGCRRYNTQQPEQDTSSQERRQKEALMQTHRQWVDEDKKKIETFVRQKGWQMQTTETGLWYMIDRQGQGEKAATNRTVTLTYALSLLDGTVCYSSEQEGTKTFRTGQGGVEPGLEEGVLLMRVGDRARLVMPPHLAYGLTGDGKCIPMRAIILYDIELLSLK